MATADARDGRAASGPVVPNAASTSSHKGSGYGSPQIEVPRRASEVASLRAARTRVGARDASGICRVCCPLSSQV
jgi:hypothetical protein